MSDASRKEGFHVFAEWLRLITPLGIFVLGIYINQVYNRLNDIDTKLFRHLTNDELHCPRTLVTEKTVFDIYVRSHEKEVDYIKDMLKEIAREVKRR